MQKRDAKELEMRVRRGQSRLVKTEDAADELAAQLMQPEIGLVVVFAASTYDLEVLAKVLAARFGDIAVVGCSTAGEIGPGGYGACGVSGFSVHRDDLRFEVGILENISSSDNGVAQRFAYRLRQTLYERVPALSVENAFALMLVDGLSNREESVSRAFYDGLGGIRLIGGSAGDGLFFRTTHVFANGRVVSDAVLLLVGWTPFPFEIFKTQHFSATSSRLVVTGAIPSKRIVTEINGCPAAEEYARAVGVPFDALDPMVFSANPVVVQFGGADFVRSIQKVNADGSLTFFCAIDEGIVFRVAKASDMVANLSSALDEVKQHIGPPSFVLACDCILRRIEMNRTGVTEPIADLLRSVNSVGFSTYGEQYCGLHVNQTMTGIAFGRRVDHE